MSSFGNFTTLSIGILCTAATSIALYYTTTYILKDHNRLSSKRRFKKYHFKLKETLDSLEKSSIENSNKIKELSETSHSLDSKKLELSLKELEISQMSLLEKLDAIQPNELMEYESYTDPALESFVLCLVEELKSIKRNLILKIQQDIDKMDRICNQAHIPPLECIHNTLKSCQVN